ncbi:hypothetical protein Tco_1136234 [Tanacetum coccineum]
MGSPELIGPPSPEATCLARGSEQAPPSSVSLPIMYPRSVYPVYYTTREMSLFPSEELPFACRYHYPLLDSPADGSVERMLRRTLPTYHLTRQDDEMTMDEMIRRSMRRGGALAPATIHVIPSPPLHIPSPPPNSPTHIKVPESCLPLHKRLRFAAPTPNYEVGESLAASAARSHRGDYTVHPIWGQSSRLPIFPTTVEQEDYHPVMQSALISELQSADHRRQRVITELLASDHKRQVQLTKTLRLLKGLQTQMVEFQRQHGPAEGPSQPDAPGEAENGTKEKDHEAMINEGVTATLAARDATRNGDDSHTSGTGVKRPVQVARECTYLDFLKCQPLNFKVTKGVVGLTQWFEKMKSVHSIKDNSIL